MESKKDIKVVMSFKELKMLCDYRFEPSKDMYFCGYYGHDGGVPCDKDNCPYVILIVERMMESYPKQQKYVV